MQRLERITPVGIPIHVIQRGNNRQVIFADESDFKVFTKVNLAEWFVC
ncbi:hypothetical protein [Thiomicrorhabdus indica]|nr:hypothetical protein [Thiomicrorhabdus indica]